MKRLTESDKLIGFNRNKKLHNKKWSKRMPKFRRKGTKNVLPGTLEVRNRRDKGRTGNKIVKTKITHPCGRARTRVLPADQVIPVLE
jgi:hypothetical protein